MLSNASKLFMHFPRPGQLPFDRTTGAEEWLVILGPSGVTVSIDPPGPPQRSTLNLGTQPILVPPGTRATSNTSGVYGYVVGPDPELATAKQELTAAKAALVEQTAAHKATLATTLAELRGAMDRVVTGVLEQVALTQFTGLVVESVRADVRALVAEEIRRIAPDERP